MENKRWHDVNNLKEEWDKRTILLAKLIEPNSNVIEFGAGRLILKNHLPKGCTYTPSDITDRGENTIVCNLNDKILPQFDHSFNTAIFSGVLEYVEDVPRLINYLSGLQTIIISYATSKLNERIKSNEWVNSYNDSDILDIFKLNGYKCIQTDIWKRQNIYKFVK